jgi:hypothetical protein
MIDAKLALIISGVGYGVTILVLVIISAIVRAITLIVQKSISERN